MGLGKTLMTISTLAWLACEKGVWGPHLIVVPTSVMLNWEMEIKKFAPAFKILTYFGSVKERKQKRAGWSKTNAFHICITSYKLGTRVGLSAALSTPPAPCSLAERAAAGLLAACASHRASLSLSGILILAFSRSLLPPPSLSRVLTARVFGRGPLALAPSLCSHSGRRRIPPQKVEVPRAR